MKQKALYLLMFIKKTLNKLSHLIPTALPRGMTEFETWAASIITTYDFPNNDSVRFALATMIIHSGPQDDAKPKYQFARAVRATCQSKLQAACSRTSKLGKLKLKKPKPLNLQKLLPHNR